MNKLLILTLFFLCSCSNNLIKNNFSFSEKMSIDEFKIKLKEYAENNPYPNLDN